MNSSIFVGLDVHKKTLSMAIAEGAVANVGHHGIFENRVEVFRKMVERLARGGRRLNFCYEAGPAATACIDCCAGLGMTASSWALVDFHASKPSE